MIDTILLNKEEIQDRHQMLKNLPENESIFKCLSCKAFFNIYNVGLLVFMSLAPKDNITCPVCKSSSTELMCKADVHSLRLKLSGFKCRDSRLISGTDICNICNMPMCPICYNHTVLSLSRVTGYMSDISGWNNAKRQELKDRKRYIVEEIAKKKC